MKTFKIFVTLLVFNLFVYDYATNMYSGIPVSRTSRAQKRKLVREIGESEKSGVKLQCLTEEGTTFGSSYREV